MLDTQVKSELDFRIELTREVNASIVDTFDSLIEQLGPAAITPEGVPMKMCLEAFPGGRWFRDLGTDDGHLWAHVQAIRRPDLVELSGPLFMSAPVANNVQYRLEEAEGVTTIRFVHTAFGPIEEGWREGMPHGWEHQLAMVAQRLGD